jgi:glucokinase
MKLVYPCFILYLYLMSEAIDNLHIPKRGGLPADGIIVLAGDMGGTKTNLSFYRATDSGLEALESKRYASDDYPSSIDVLKQFLTDTKQSAVDRICLGVAGPVLNKKVELTNIGWSVDTAEMRRQLGIEKVALINDLEATAYGLAGLGPEDFITIHPGKTGNGNMAIIAPGTGLGEGGLYWSGKNHYPFPTEGGHAGFAPRTETDIELLKYLQKKHEVVSWEHLVAGPAIPDIYRFLRDSKKHKEPGWLTEAIKDEEEAPAAISKAAIEQKDNCCVETMQYFVRYLAYESANLVMKIKATGGLFLGGGVPHKIAPLLQDKSFFEHYLDCDRMQHLLENVPIRIVKNDKTGLIGAAYYGAYGEW